MNATVTERDLKVPLDRETQQIWQAVAGHSSSAAAGLNLSLARPDARERDAVTAHAVTALLQGLTALGRLAGCRDAPVYLNPNLQSFLKEHC